MWLAVCPSMPNIHITNKYRYMVYAPEVVHTILIGNIGLSAK